MLWNGEVEDAKNIDELSTSASIQGRPIPDFENLDFKIACGLKKNLTGDFFKIRGDNEAILDFRDLSKVQLMFGNFQAFDTKWDEVLQAVTDRPTDSILESLFQMQVEKSEALTYLLQVHAQETTFGDWKYDDCRLKLMTKDISSIISRILVSKREIETVTDLHWKLRAKGKRKEKRQNQCQKQGQERRLHSLDHKKASVHLEMHAHSIMNQTREAEERADPVYLLRQVHL